MPAEINSDLQRSSRKSEYISRGVVSGEGLAKQIPDGLARIPE